MLGVDCYAETIWTTGVGGWGELAPLFPGII